MAIIRSSGPRPFAPLSPQIGAIAERRRRRLSGTVIAQSPPPPPPPAGYVAKAVHFDGATWLINAALASSDNGTASMSCWFKEAAGTGYRHWIVDPNGDYGSFFTTLGNGVSMGFAEAGGLNAIGTPDMPNTPGVWYHILASCDVRRATPLLICYLNDVAAGQPSTIFGTLSGTSTLAFNGKDLWVGSDNNLTLNGDLADLWLAPGVSLLDVGGDIPLSARRKFIDGSGKPVDLGSDGSTPTGVAPVVFLSGDANTFATNRGAGGAFVTSGALTTVAGP